MRNKMKKKKKSNHNEIMHTSNWNERNGERDTAKPIKKQQKRAKKKNNNEMEEVEKKEKQLNEIDEPELKRILMINNTNAKY